MCFTLGDDDDGDDDDDDDDDGDDGDGDDDDYDDQHHHRSLPSLRGPFAPPPPSHEDQDAPCRPGRSWLGFATGGRPSTAAPGSQRDGGKLVCGPGPPAFRGVPRRGGRKLRERGKHAGCSQVRKAIEMTIEMIIEMEGSTIEMEGSTIEMEGRLLK